MLHLHRLEYGDQLALGDLLADTDGEGEDDAGHRGDQASVAAARHGRPVGRLRDGEARRRGCAEAPGAGERTAWGLAHGERRVVLEKGGGGGAGPHLGLAHEPAQERQVGDHARDARGVERGGEAVEGLVARGAVCDQLGDHRVVARGDLVAGADAKVDADAVGQVELAQEADAGQERERVLGVQAHLDRVAARRRRGGHVAAVGDADHLRDQVDARDELGDRVLDLDARVQLEEPDLFTRDEELGGAGTAVTGRAGEGGRRGVEPGA